MTVHQLHPNGHHMPLSWQHRLTDASTESGVVDVARDFVAQFSPYEIATLPHHCRPGKFHDSTDLTEYAFALVRHRCDDGEGSTYIMHRLADFFSQATVRLSQILHANNQRENAQDGRQSA